MKYMNEGCEIDRTNVILALVCLGWLVSGTYLKLFNAIRASIWFGLQCRVYTALQFYFFFAKAQVT